MPLVRINILKSSIGLEKKRLLVKEVVGVMTSILNVREDAIRVIINEDEPANVGIGSKLVCDLKL